MKTADILKAHQGHEIRYSPKHDATFCVDCDKWLVPVCRNVNCDFCSGRPDKPSLLPPYKEVKAVFPVSVTFSDNEPGHPCSRERAIELILKGRAIPTGVRLKQNFSHKETER